MYLFICVSIRTIVLHLGQEHAYVERAERPECTEKGLHSNKPVNKDQPVNS